MAKPLSSFPEEERYKIANRRITNKTMRLSYWAAIDYMLKTKKMPKEIVK